MHAAMHTSVTLKNRSGLVFSLMPCHEQSNSPRPLPPLFCTLSCARVITSPGSWFELPPSTKATKTCSPPLAEGFEHLSTIRRRCKAACCEDKHGRVPLVQLSSALLSSLTPRRSPGQATLGTPLRGAGAQTRQQRAQVKGQKELACHGDEWGSTHPERGQKQQRKRKGIQERVLTTENREISLAQ